MSVEKFLFSYCVQVIWNDEEGTMHMVYLWVLQSERVKLLGKKATEISKKINAEGRGWE